MSRTAVVEGNEIKYHVMDPTGNITILVETPVEEASQPFIAAELMRLEPDAEQVGFLTIPEKRAAGTRSVEDADTQSAGDAESARQKAAKTPVQSADDQKFWDIALRMAGGEFCGNATMSAAAFYADRTGMREGTVTVRVSGAAEPVPVEICLAAAEPVPAEILPDPAEPAYAEMQPDSEETSSGPDLQAPFMPVYRGTVTMPRPVAITEAMLPDFDSKEAFCSYPVVHFEGIDHVILEMESDQVRAEELAPLWCRELQTEAVGLMFLNRSEGTLTPLVYVPEAGTLVWENSCASGTSAVGAWAASCLQAAVQREYSASERDAIQKSKPAVQLSLQEPGGILHVEVSTNGVIRLTGTVRERSRTSG